MGHGGLLVIPISESLYPLDNFFSIISGKVIVYTWLFNTQVYGGAMFTFVFLQHIIESLINLKN